MGFKGVMKHSGKEFWSEEFNCKIMPLMHPSYVLQNPPAIRQFMSHLARVNNILTGKLVDPTDIGEYVYITDIEMWRVFYEEIKKSKYFIYDIETNGHSPFREDAVIKCIGFSLREREAYVLPLGIWSPDEGSEIIRGLHQLFSSKRIAKVGQNIKFDNMWLRTHFGIEVVSSKYDTMSAEALLFELESTALKDMTWKYTRLGGYEEALGGAVQDAPNDPILWKYCGMDSDVTHRVMNAQKVLLEKEPKLLYLLNNLIMPVTDVLGEMERRGMLVDTARVDASSLEVDAALESIVAELRNDASVKKFEAAHNVEFNPNSHIQLREVLFRYEGLDIIKVTKKNRQPSTDLEVLASHRDVSNLCNLLFEYSTYGTMKKTFLKELLELVTSDHRIHTTFWLTRARSGRTSSSDPNLQNIPKGDKDRIGIRRAFLADPDYFLAELDYNQHELRIMATASKDTVLRKNLLAGDVHRATASALLGIPPEKITSEQRARVGKTFNFGLIFGMTVYGLKRRLGCSEGEAQLFLNKYFDTYASVAKWMKSTEAFVREHEYVETLSGRKRRFPSWKGLGDKQIREAINTPIQGTAGDCLLYALIGVSNFLKAHKCKSFLTLEVHDCMLLNVHKTELDILPEIANIMVEYPTKFMDLSFMPLDVECKMGKDWGSMESYKVR
jgi:DNA polymerase-1